MRMISDNIGWDGSEFFCRRCGKAGYSKMAQVRGHLAMCPGRAISKGAIPQTAVATGLRAVKPTVLGSIPGFANPVNQQQLQTTPSGVYSQLDGRVKQLENEYQHMLVERNLPAGDWFSRNKNMLLVVALLFGFYLMTRNGQCQCDNGSKVVKNGVASLGEKALAKFVDRGITKGVDSLFGK